tara:strand:- start:1511 stop:2341 length:831 start_codon:yes stop_codon:yes gene_type:complete
LILEHRDIVLGSSLDAVLFAFNNKYPIFFAEIERPFRFDFLPPDLDLSCLKIAAPGKSLTTFEGEKKVGVTKEMLWERLLFLLTLGGHAPTANLCKSIRHNDDTITCFNEYSKIAEVRYEKLYDFTYQTKSNSLICYDWVAFNSGGKHEFDLIETEDDFVSKIWFYSSDRICGNTKVKDACAVSIINKDLIDDFDYSETMARFKVVKEMENRGMKGLLSSYGPNGRPKHYKFKTSTIGRQKKNTQNKKTKNIPEQESLIKQLSKSSFFYEKYLRHL